MRQRIHTLAVDTVSLMISDSATTLFLVTILRVNMDCVRIQIQESTREAVSMMISKSVAAQFSMTISESTKVVWADESTSYLWKQFQ